MRGRKFADFYDHSSILPFWPLSGILTKTTLKIDRGVKDAVGDEAARETKYHNQSFNPVRDDEQDNLLWLSREIS